MYMQFFLLMFEYLKSASYNIWKYFLVNTCSIQKMFVNLQPVIAFPLESFCTNQMTGSAGSCDEIE